MNTIISSRNSQLIALDLEPSWVARMPQIAAAIDAQLAHRPEIIVCGRKCRQNRSVGFFSDTSRGYRYSGNIVVANPMTDELRELTAFINDKFGSSFNGILVNKYEDGSESIGKHSDDESGLDRTAGVVVISVGAVRNLRIRVKSTGVIAGDVPTRPDKILQMCGRFQSEFTHEIPVDERVRGTRYSFTFRKHSV